MFDGIRLDTTSACLQPNPVSYRLSRCETECIREQHTLIGGRIGFPDMFRSVASSVHVRVVRALLIQTKGGTVRIRTVAPPYCGGRRVAT